MQLCLFPLMFCAIIGAKDISDISVAIITLIIITIFYFCY